MKFLLVGSGSRGDAQPMIALALGLCAAGHEAIVAARPMYGRDAAELGVSFEPVGVDAADFAAAQGGDAKGVLAFLEQELEAQLGRLPDVAAKVDRVIGAGMSFGARSVAEAVGAPFVAVVYTPNVLGEDRPRLPRRLDQIVQRWRALRGLAPMQTDLMRHAHPPERALVAADPELSGAPLTGLSWPATGALLLDDPRPLGADVEAFLSAGETPIYVGFGSMEGTVPALGTGLVRDAVEAAGCRAIVTGIGASAGRILRIAGASHHKLFPRVKAIVHHGGAGTTAAAARAGVPQVIVPHAFDQPFWAAQAHRLGLAPPPISAHRVDAIALAQAIRQALEDPRIQACARALGGALAARRLQRCPVDAATAILTSELPALR